MGNLFSQWYIKYIPFVALATMAIFVFSLFMAGVSGYRENISKVNYTEIENIYSGPLRQDAPVLNSLDSGSSFYKVNNLTPELAKLYLDNTNLVSTNGSVKIIADFVKKGLVYQPTYKTQFQSDFVLKNTLNKESLISFDFPFPSSTNSSEISNAKLLVNGKEYENAKTTIKKEGASYGSQGLRWEGKIPANSEVKISVSYNTVGLSQFSYQGAANSAKSQNFNFKVIIEGTRAYDVNGGLSVDKREFGTNNVTLTWEKNDLYSTPSIDVTVGNKINPSEQVSRVYFTMSPIYIVFIVALLFLSKRFSKEIKLFDLGIITTLFVIFFPFFHYLSSFTVDPTTEIFANFNVAQYSMPLYLAFGLAFAVIAGITYYLLTRVTSMSFATKLGIPLLVLALGFFPLVATIPEYFMLLTLVGVIAILAIVIQVRVTTHKLVD